MNEKIKVAIFPYNPNYIPVLKNKNLLRDIEICHLLSPSGFGLTGKDGYIYDDTSGYKIQDGFSKKILEEIDCVWLTETIDDFKDEDISYLLENISKYEKGVILSKSNSVVEELCEKLNIELTNPDTYVKEYGMLKSEDFRQGFKFKKFETPVITVLGASENTQKFDLQLYLRNKFTEHGYKVSQVGTKSFCEFLGFHSLPAYFYDDDAITRNNVIDFNNYLHEINQNEKPDVIIVGIPEGIFELNSTHTFNFGTKAYEMCNAFTSDYSILSIFDGTYNDDFYEQMEAVCKYKLNVDLDAFFVSNYGIVTNSIDTQTLAYTYVTDRENGSDDYTVFNATSLNGDEIFEDVVDKLSLYGTFKSM